MTLPTAPASDTLLPDQYGRLCEAGGTAELHERLHWLVMVNRQLRAELATALTCPVTQLPSRAAWTTYAQRYIATWPAAVLVADLDRFKPINDRYGHEVGDEVLAATGQRIQQWCLNHGGRAGSWGGDEFVAIVPDWEGLSCSVQRLQTELQGPIRSGRAGLLLSIRASVGTARLAELPQPNLAWALRAADDVMYQDKRGARRRLRSRFRSCGRRLADVLASSHAPAVFTVGRQPADALTRP
jgi:diguanylate cyclase (GGDEF)-like protein